MLFAQHKHLTYLINFHFFHLFHEVLREIHEALRGIKKLSIFPTMLVIMKVYGFKLKLWISSKVLIISLLRTQWSRKGKCVLEIDRFPFLENMFQRCVLLYLILLMKHFEKFCEMLPEFREALPQISGSASRNKKNFNLSKYEGILDYF